MLTRKLLLWEDTDTKAQASHLMKVALF